MECDPAHTCGVHLPSIPYPPNTRPPFRASDASRYSHSSRPLASLSFAHTVPSTSARAAIQQLHMPKYHDQLMLDLGYATCRKCNPLSEALAPYTARDYSSIFRHGNDRKKSTGTSKHVTVVTVWPEVNTT